MLSSLARSGRTHSNGSSENLYSIVSSLAGERSQILKEIIVELSSASSCILASTPLVIIAARPSTIRILIDPLKLAYRGLSLLPRMNLLIVETAAGKSLMRTFRVAMFCLPKTVFRNV